MFAWKPRQPLYPWQIQRFGAYLAPAQVIPFGSARLCLSNLSIDKAASALVNQKARGFGRLGRSGIMKKPKKPQTTVMIALIMKSQLNSRQSWLSFAARGDRPPSSKPALPLQRINNSNLQRTRHHTPHRLTRMIESHAFRQFSRRIPVHE